MLTKSTKSLKPQALLKLSKGKFAIVDADLYDDLNRHYWRAVQSHNCWYAKRRYWVNGKLHDVFMHRIIANTHKGMVCHHRNGDSLDNRRYNLRNMTPAFHEALHAEKRIQRQANYIT